MYPCHHLTAGQLWNHEPGLSILAQVSMVFGLVVQLHNVHKTCECRLERPQPKRTCRCRPTDQAAMNRNQESNSAAYDSYLVQISVPRTSLIARHSACSVLVCRPQSLERKATAPVTHQSAVHWTLAVRKIASVALQPRQACLPHWARKRSVVAHFRRSLRGIETLSSP